MCQVLCRNSGDAPCNKIEKKRLLMKGNLQRGDELMRRGDIDGAPAVFVAAICLRRDMEWASPEKVVLPQVW